MLSIAHIAYTLTEYIKSFRLIRFTFYGHVKGVIDD